MLDISRKQIEAVREDPTLCPEARARLSEPSLADKPSANLCDGDWADLHDACLDTLVNDAPIVESFNAEQSKGIYEVVIRGVPGAYFVTAPEFESEGIFSTIEDARGSADAFHGEFRLTDKQDDSQEEIDEGWADPDPTEPTFPEALLPLLATSDDPDAVNAIRRQVLANSDLVMLANGYRAPGCHTRPKVAHFVSAFEQKLPKPQGTIDGMARMLSKTPRLRLRVELFLRLNGRLPTHHEAQQLYAMR